MWSKPKYGENKKIDIKKNIIELPAIKKTNQT